MRLDNRSNTQRLAFSSIFVLQIVIDAQVLSPSAHMETDAQEAAEISQLLDVCEQRDFY